MSFGVESKISGSEQGGMNGIFFGGGVNLAILHKIEPYKQILEKNYVMQPFD